MFDNYGCALFARLVGTLSCSGKIFIFELKSLSLQEIQIKRRSRRVARSTTRNKVT